jgi:hypothetical protein
VFWRFFWHKVARLLCPAALAVVFVASCFAHGYFANAVFVAQIYLYSLAAFGHYRRRQAGRMAVLCHTFVMLNAAVVVGFLSFVRRSTRITWMPTSTLGGGSATH